MDHGPLTPGADNISKVLVSLSLCYRDPRHPQLVSRLYMVVMVVRTDLVMEIGDSLWNTYMAVDIEMYNETVLWVYPGSLDSL